MVKSGQNEWCIAAMVMTFFVTYTKEGSEMLITVYGDDDERHLIDVGKEVVDIIASTNAGEIPMSVFPVMTPEARFLYGAKPMIYVRVEAGPYLLTKAVVTTAGACIKNMAGEVPVLVGFFPAFRYFLSRVGELYVGPYPQAL